MNLEKLCCLRNLIQHFPSDFVYEAASGSDPSLLLCKDHRSELDTFLVP